MIWSGCELEDENVDAESSAFFVLDKKELESFTDISESTDCGIKIFKRFPNGWRGDSYKFGERNVYWLITLVFCT